MPVRQNRTMIAPLGAVFAPRQNRLCMLHASPLLAHQVSNGSDACVHFRKQQCIHGRPRVPAALCVCRQSHWASCVINEQRGCACAHAQKAGHCAFPIRRAPGTLGGVWSGAAVDHTGHSGARLESRRSKWLEPDVLHYTYCHGALHAPGKRHASSKPQRARISACDSYTIDTPSTASCHTKSHTIKCHETRCRGGIRYTTKRKASVIIVR
jgi:hypothetical protein